jgi:hypothetical protein
MTGVVADRVKETTTTSGTGNITLAGAVASFQTFNAAFNTNVYFYYCIVDADGVDWEVGRGYLSGSTTLVRSVILASSNSNTVVSLSAGTHSIFSTIPADLIEDLNGKILSTITGMNLP